MTDPTVSAKAEGAMRTIGEVSAELGVKPHILRYWEAQFDTITPLKRAGGRRYYRAEDVETLRTINRLLNQEGFTVRGARQLLASKTGPAVVETPKAPVQPTPPLDVAALRAIRDRLAAALEAA
ncbi:MerR family transcriptional regulator [Blastomonas sp. AAP53]|uniref:MerR family transcriptional regulator n=1 Tax=Blastomonas sp. AAP53 TaxID=1248760 RepID=UPI0002D9F70A|nr:MerR family transcriptional regulator [Blastomonas sp. AAP53]